MQKLNLSDCKLKTDINNVINALGSNQCLQVMTMMEMVMMMIMDQNMVRLGELQRHEMAKELTKLKRFMQKGQSWQDSNLLL